MFFGRRISTHFDYVLILLIIPLILVSTFLLSETSTALMYRQLSYSFLGIFVFVFVFFVPFRYLYKSVIAFYVICILLLIAVDLIGTTKLGAQRWISIGGFSLQPSEPVKIAIILLLAHYIHHNPPPKGGYGILEFCKISFFILLPFLLILKEPDLGTALVVLIMGYGMLFIIGVNKKIWITIIVVIVIFVPIAYKFEIVLKKYQIDRIQTLISGKPKAQVYQSLIAVGSGGLTGKSKEDSTQSNLKFLPIATSDFIFAHFAERFGFIGSLILIILYMSIVVHIFSFCFIESKDYFMRVIASCVALLFFIYVIVNIGMTIELAPVVGIPLPLFSYGGSSFITFIVLLAMLENAKVFRFELSYNPDSNNTNLFGKIGSIIKRKNNLFR
ncbi:FtsW/RodA/SpoVE family cell cycle protein [Helicobacter sp. 11S02629-2]|uniref:FtsW/RodA/SpoVE family cell cycle protein n=1 Tax=Helicobacter sp. 11S02629-2 TaxID=1476195 RepID=UPI000BA660C2|nr:FtsW/RodA/SpoVE family cell cycle protein [Helicobacter sp. 11S02629-2]PAF44123.1 rod shape-determining protein RodA [Helicobacter sp. 11S02629-2]